MLLQKFMQEKRKILEDEFQNMNDMQKQAIFSIKGPVLILAGAGSGKTTTIVNRIAYLLKHGDAYFSEEGFEEFKKTTQDENFKLDDKFLKVDPPKPEEILAITFTNKAAKELCNKLNIILKDSSNKINAGTFHSQCIKILVKYINLIGYKNNFVIYDTNDSKSVLKGIISSLNLNNKIFQPKSILYEISKAKNKFLNPIEYEKKHHNDKFRLEVSKIYALYQENLKKVNALDFDDILCCTVKLFQENKNILTKYQEKFKYIMVDEYQDTNYVQYELIRLLSESHNNLCVVGDDDQSIYKFRGAAIENILNFESQMKNVKIIKLEQNYRSTKNILSAAYSVISHNNLRKDKKIWTDKKNGSKVQEIHVTTENEEAEFVCQKINENVTKGIPYKSHVILYRVNAQSANMEKFLVRHSIPYQIIGSTKFYDRKEIKDIIAYLTVLDNFDDNLRLVRIINEPKRGIGTGTVHKLEKLSKRFNVSIYEIIKTAENYDVLSGKLKQLKDFYILIEDLKNNIKNKRLPEIFDDIINKTKYLEYLKEQREEENFRTENLKEFKSILSQFEIENENATLSDFLFEISLYTDINEYNKESDKIFLMTIHTAKGLEFPNVFMIGMEEGIFPGNLSMEDKEDLEEERRLAYVGITRAKENLYLTYAAQRMIFGSIKYSKPSRFLEEIPITFKEIDDRISKNHAIKTETEKQKIKFSTNNFKKFEFEKPIKIDFDKDDFVFHSVFGKGLVLAITPTGNDHLVEIDFETRGRKKVMANYAKLKKI